MGHCIPLAAEVGYFYSFYNNITRSREKRGPFWMKIQILDSKPCKCGRDKENKIKEKRGFLGGESTKNRLTAPIF